MTSKHNLAEPDDELAHVVAANAADAYVVAEQTERHARSTRQRARAALLHWLGGEGSRTLPDGRRVVAVSARGGRTVSVRIGETPARVKVLDADVVEDETP